MCWMEIHIEIVHASHDPLNGGARGPLAGDPALSIIASPGRDRSLSNRPTRSKDHHIGRHWSVSDAAPRKADQNSRSSTAPEPINVCEPALPRTHNRRCYAECIWGYSPRPFPRRRDLCPAASLWRCRPPSRRQPPVRGAEMRGTSLAKGGHAVTAEEEREPAPHGARSQRLA
jgi:hypothetical protein